MLIVFIITSSFQAHTAISFSFGHFLVFSEKLTVVLCCQIPMDEIQGKRYIKKEKHSSCIIIALEIRQ